MAAVGVHGLIYLIQRSTGGRETITTGHDRLWCVAYSRDGRTLAISSGQSTVKLWDLERDRARISISVPTASLSSVEFSAGGKTLTIADHRGSLWVYDAGTGHLETVRRIDAGTSIVRAALSQDSRRLVTVGENLTMTVWELPGGLRLIICATPAFI